MRAIKGFFSNIHRYLFWLVISCLLWAWIYSLITDAPRAKKVVVYTNTPAVSDKELAMELEKDLPEGIRMIQVHPFSYSAFNTGAPDAADIYILSEEDIKNNIDMLVTLSPRSGNDLYVDGSCYGWLIFDAESDKGAADSFIGYLPEDAVPEGAVPTEDPEAQNVEPETPVNYYICFNKTSPHLGELNDSSDSAALIIAERLLDLP